MSVACKRLIEAMEKLAPSHLAEKWDAIGLQAGNPNQAVDCVMVALDVSEATIAEAIAQKANMIISHHPFIFKPLAHARTDQPQGRMLKALLAHDICVFSAHTNLDIAPGGVNDVLSRMLKLTDVQNLRETACERLFKLAVFVPESHAQRVREAICVAGAGHIGNYSCCTFQSSGTGTFLPLAGTSPFLGEQGKLEFAAEYKIETIVPENILAQVVEAMKAAHPYEEVAYDLFLLQNRGAGLGLGRVGNLSDRMVFNDFANVVKNILGICRLRICGDNNRTISRVAVCGGSGAGLIPDALRAGADVLVTGDVKYHEAQEAFAAGLALIDAGHFATERPVVTAVVEFLTDYADKNNWNLRVIASNHEKDTFQWV